MRLFHVSPKNNLDIVLRDGLKPFTQLSPSFFKVDRSLEIEELGLNRVYFVYGNLDKVSAFSVGWVFDSFFSLKISLLKGDEASSLSCLDLNYPFDNYVLLEYDGSVVKGLELETHETNFPGENSEIVAMASVIGNVPPDFFVRTYEFPDISTAGRELIELERQARVAYVALLAGGIPQRFWKCLRKNESAESIRKRVLDNYGKNFVPCLAKGLWYRKALKDLLGRFE